MLGCLLGWLLPRLVGHWDGGLAEADCVARAAKLIANMDIGGLVKGLAVKLTSGLLDWLFASVAQAHC